MTFHNEEDWPATGRLDRGVYPFDIYAQPNCLLSGISVYALYSKNHPLLNRKNESYPSRIAITRTGFPRSRLTF